MYKNCKVVMLSNNKKAGTIWKTLNDQLIHTHISGEYKEKYQSQHLYITSDDEIKEERLRWIIDNREGMNNFIHQVSVILDSKLCPEILATTDSSLKVVTHIPWSKELESKYDYEKGYPKEITLPQPPKEFIEHFVSEYNEGNIITDVLVEYDNYLPDTDGDFGKIQLKKDNTINIKPVKDSWSREEVIELLTKIVKEEPEETKLILYWDWHKKWIEKNL